MKKAKILILLSASFALILGMFLASQFIFISDLFRGVLSGLKHNINPPKISKDFEVISSLNLPLKILKLIMRMFQIKLKQIHS